MKHKGQVDYFVTVLLTIILGLVLVLVITSLAPQVGNGGQAIATGVNQSAASQAIAPQFSTLWAVTGLGIIIGIMMAVLGRR